MIEGFKACGETIRRAHVESLSRAGVKDSRERLRNYKELKVWEKFYKLCLEVYRITKVFPKNELYGLNPK